VTFAGGLGFGAEARVGPVRPGLYGGVDCYGWRAGHYMHGTDGDVTAGFTTPLPICLFVTDEWVYTADGCFIEPRTQKPPDPRKKEYIAYGLYVPFVTWTRDACPSYYTQIEVAAAVGVGFRLGFNPGELLDFVLGWTTLDIYGDDISLQEEPKNQ
jgi:hypothetical protein